MIILILCISCVLMLLIIGMEIGSLFLTANPCDDSGSLMIYSLFVCFE